MPNIILEYTVDAGFKKISEYDPEIPQSHTAEQPTAQ